MASLCSPEKQGLILFSLRELQLLFRFPGAAEDSWAVTQHHHLGTATLSQLLRAGGQLGLLPGMALRQSWEGTGLVGSWGTFP